MSWENCKYISSYEKSMNVACNKSEISIKISSSGMFSNGRIMNHVKTMIEDSNCTFVLCGYQGEGTVGRELQRTDNTEVKIEGMMCGHCSGRVKKCLEQIEGIESADVSHEIGTAVVKMNKEVPDEVLIKTIEEEGYKVLGIE